MDLNRLTQKSQEALAAAQDLARQRNHQVIEPEHILHALLSQTEGLVFPLVQKLGGSPRTLRDRVEELLSRIPKVFGPEGDTYVSSGMRKVLDRADVERQRL